MNRSGKGGDWRLNAYGESIRNWSKEGAQFNRNVENNYSEKKESSPSEKDTDETWERRIADWYPSGNTGHRHTRMHTGI